MSFKRRKTDNTEENELDLAISAGSRYKGGKRVRKGDIIALILSVLAAIALWFYVMGVEAPTAEMDFFGVRVQYQNENQMLSENGWSLLSEDSSTVDVKLRGKKSTLNRMSSEDIIAYVDLRLIDSVGETRLPVKFTLPEGVTCISEQTALVQVDEVVSKKVPVSAEVQNYSSAADLILGDLVCDLQEITVTGPNSTVKLVESAKVLIDMGGEQLTESRMFSVTPVLTDAEEHPVRSNYLELSNNTVNVRLPVYLSKDLDLKVTYKYGYFNDENVSVVIEPARIRVKGEPSVIRELNEVVLGTLDETAIEDNAAYNMAIPLPAGTISMDGATAATVRLEHVGTSVKRITVKDFRVDAPEGLQYKILTSSIDVLVRCDTGVVNSLDLSAITAGVDLSTVGDLKGRVEKKVTVNLTGQFKDTAYVLGEYTVTVELGVQAEKNG